MYYIICLSNFTYTVCSTDPLFRNRSISLKIRCKRLISRPLTNLKKIVYYVFSDIVRFLQVILLRFPDINLQTTVELHLTYSWTFLNIVIYNFTFKLCIGKVSSTFFVIENNFRSSMRFLWNHLNIRNALKHLYQPNGNNVVSWKMYQNDEWRLRRWEKDDSKMA